MQLLGSIILRNLYFLQYGDSLVHWTHSFLYLHNTPGFFFFQDGMFHKKQGKNLWNLSIDKCPLHMV